MGESIKTEIQFKIEDNFDDECASLTRMNNMAGDITRYQIDLTESQVRRAIILLGWTPHLEKLRWSDIFWLIIGKIKGEDHD